MSANTPNSTTNGDTADRDDGGYEAEARDPQEQCERLRRATHQYIETGITVLVGPIDTKFSPEPGWNTNPGLIHENVNDKVNATKNLFVRGGDGGIVTIDIDVNCDSEPDTGNREGVGLAHGHRRAAIETCQPRHGAMRRYSYRVHEIRFGRHRDSRAPPSHDAPAVTAFER